MSNRIRGIRSPLPQGFVIGRTDSGQGPAHLIQADKSITLKNKKIRANFGVLTGDISVDPNDAVSVLKLLGIPLDVSSLTNGFVLTYDSGTSTLKLAAASGGGGSSSFIGLTDVPASYSGAGLKGVRVNSGATALEFHAPAFLDLIDGPGSYSGGALKAVRVNAGGTALEFYTPSSGGATAFTGLSDVPASYTGQALKIVRVNAGETALEFATSSSGGAGPFQATAAKAVLSNFSWVNQGTATAADSTSGIQVVPAVHGGASPTLQLLVQNAPSTPFTIYARFTWETPSLQFAEIGLAAYNSSNGRLVKCTLLQDNTPFQWFLQRWTNPTTFNATPASHAAMTLKEFWMKMAITSTSIAWDVSPDGYNWRHIFDETISTFITASGGTLDQVGAIFGAPQNNVDTYNAILNCWDTNAPT